MRAIQSLIPLSLAACASFDRLGPGYSEELDEYHLQNSNGVNDGSSLQDPNNDIELISDSECFNPCTFQTITDNAAYVIYSADEWVIGRSEDSETDFSVEYSFQTLGLRTVKVQAFDLSLIHI